MYHVRKERLYFYCTVLSNSLQQGTFSPRPSYSVIAIGIRQAGKSMLFAKLSGTILKKLEPTVGFSVKAVQLPSAILNVKELGGKQKIRKYCHTTLEKLSGKCLWWTAVAMMVMWI
ncbi:unnamed protein product [Pocillopora meandrina]|uniref:G domain-containing protein n=1 Tax=Pocillopora meandrina TaxID=46732 RepID=A0AAU9VWS2_9CNID|nr:unnamed protein product [Pocillopora meandrina]